MYVGRYMSACKIIFICRDNIKHIIIFDLGLKTYLLSLFLYGKIILGSQQPHLKMY